MSKGARSGISAANYITVVTGLPRSGTSMMMQMLAAGGIPALTDEQRRADEDNPKGYFEIEKAKNLRQDSSWVSQVEGYAVKIIAQLIEYLPPDNYRYIFMQRDLNEVVSSQRAMLQRSEKRGAQLSEEQLKGIFAKQILRVEKMLEDDRASVLKIDYCDCVDRPAATATTISRFLELPLDEKAMVAVVDAKLYRQRK